MTRPVAGVDYPQTLAQFDAWFCTEGGCVDFLRKVRWPLTGFECPTCSSSATPWSTGRGLLKCRGCGHQASVTAGTPLEKTRKPLRMWLQAMWFLASQKRGLSAVDLQRLLGCGSYQTAWTWLHKLRRVMVVPGREQLTGWVDVDETYIGAEAGAPLNNVARTGRGANKALVVIAVEVQEGRLGRIRLGRIPNATTEHLTKFVTENVEPGSTVRTDGWAGYLELKAHGYYHERVIQTANPKSQPHVLLPAVHQVASLLKRWWLGTHQGAPEVQHLDYYLDEFTFRFNRRTSKSRGLVFFRLVQQAMAAEPSPYKSIVGGSRDTGLEPREHFDKQARAAIRVRARRRLKKLLASTAPQDVAPS